MIFWREEDGSWLVDGHYSLHDFLTYFELDDLIITMLLPQ
jgi:CBS domain containing-hemolysin-like protein